MVIFHDRLTGKPVEEPLDGKVILGRYIIDSEGKGRMNGVDVIEGDALVPGSSGQWRLLTDETPTKGGFVDDPLPDEQMADAIRSFCELLGDGESNNWLGWSNKSPLAPGLSDALAIQPLEIAIERELGHLEDVCHRPQTHIRLEPERVAVARARRFDRNVYQYLASHTEDWAQRKLSGVQPSHVLAQVREEEWSIYENLVTVRLVDELVQWLRRRLTELRAIVKGVLDELENQSVAAGANWRRRDRLYKIWGEATQDSSLRDKANATIKKLEELLYRLLGLMDSPLYKNIPKRAPIPIGLRMTNLFANHDQYRGVARLWQEWAKYGVKRSPSPQQLYALHQQLVSGFNSWSMLLVVRSLEQLNYSAIECDWESSLAAGCVVELERGFRLEWRGDGIRLFDSDADQLRLRLLPIVQPLDRIPTARCDEVQQSVENSVATRDEWTLILYPQSTDPTNTDFAGEVDLPKPDNSGNCSFLPVSPFRLDSVERLSRRIRWALMVPRMMDYPPALPGTPKELGNLPHPWFEYKDGKPRLIRPISEYERDKLGVDKSLEDAQRSYVELEQKEQQIKQQLAKCKGDRRKQSELNKEKRLLAQPLDNAKQKVLRLGEFQKALELAKAKLLDLVMCPVCGTTQNTLNPRKNGFEVTCQKDECGTSWGIRQNKNGSTVPFLSISHELPDGYTADQVDQFLGCDVLSVQRQK